MKRDVLFAGMDIIKELETIKQYSNISSSESMSSGFDYAVKMLNMILNENLGDASCVVHIPNLEVQEEFFKSDLFKYLDIHGFNLPCVK